MCVYMKPVTSLNIGKRELKDIPLFRSDGWICRNRFIFWKWKYSFHTSLLVFTTILLPIFTKGSCSSVNQARRLILFCQTLSVIWLMTLSRKMVDMWPEFSLAKGFLCLVCVLMIWVWFTIDASRNNLDLFSTSVLLNKCFKKSLVKIVNFSRDGNWEVVLVGWS